MHTQNEIRVNAPLETVFALGAEIGRWAEILPHYRRVTVTEDDGRVKQAEMAAFRHFGSLPFPVRWRTSQVLLPEEGRIIFFHTGGITRGMYVEWVLTPEADGSVRVVIAHELRYPLPFLTGWFARYIVGNIFIHHIAGRTLKRVKEIAEASSE
ncbi:MAG: hypothetical protein OHK0029_12800 [Armatimonadaceae bacterium]